MLTPYLQDADCTLYAGDALDVLRELPDESVHCIATSPPFYALRDYGVDGQIGLESTPEEWAARLVEVFREARRVLRRDGTLWVECGDSYASDSKWGGASGNKNYTSAAGGMSREKRRTGLKDKDLLGTPWLLTFALRADGWWLRGCNIWAKPNAMPESAKDRCTTAHSYVFQLSRSARYFFDGDAISEPAAWDRWGDQTVPKHEGTETAAGWIPAKTKNELAAEFDHRRAGLVGQRWKETGRQTNGPRERTDERRGFDNRLERADGMKHPRSVWTIPTQGFPEAHFATWPEALARRIILAGCPEWVCSVCGKARERITSVAYGKSPAHGAGSIVGSRGVTERGSSHLTEGATNKEGRGGQPRVAKLTTTEGFTDCGHNAYVPGTVLDPFAGSGTTCYVARKLGRRSIGIDLNPEYLAMASRRLAQQSLLAQEEPYESFAASQGGFIGGPHPADEESA